MFSGIATCIAKQFGPNCEVVVHDLTQPYDHTIIHIENGYITGRKIGDSGTNIGLEVLRGTTGKDNADRYNYVNHAKNGRILRSSSKYIKDQDGTIIGSLCINFDITDLMMAQRTIYAITFLDGADDTQEVFTGNVDELLQVLLRSTLTILGKTVSEMTKEDKVKAVRYLDQKGAFLIKKSAEIASAFLGISKFTLYNYLEEGRDSAVHEPADA